jgi:orotidine-5'-phosphate decarboxylase
MINFADRLVTAVRSKSSPCIVGLDPRLESIPEFITGCRYTLPVNDAITSCITQFHELVLDAISELVPAVKLQIAFYERYGLPGLAAFGHTIRAAKDRGLLVIVDAKRNDIASTAEAYADEFLGMTEVFGAMRPVYDVDCLTVSPFLGRDSLAPFIDACHLYGKGIFVLVKTSNPGSADIQDELLLETGRPCYEKLAKYVDELGAGDWGNSGYSSVGAVVGATFPEEATTLRKLMPRAIILVPGYGAQGGTAVSAANCFNDDGLGAVVNASRSITYSYSDRRISKADLESEVRQNTLRMNHDIRTTLAARFGVRR